MNALRSPHPHPHSPTITMLLHAITIIISDLVLLKILLGVLYGSFSILALVQCIRVVLVKRTMNNRMMLQCLLFIAPLVRFILLVIPPDVFEQNIFPHEWLQVCLDLLPEILFWQTYVVLVLIWAELYHFARNMKDNTIERALHMVFIVVSALTYVFAICFAVWMNFKEKYSEKPESIFLAFLQCAALFCFAVYGFLLYKRMERVPFFPVNRKYKMLRKVKLIVIAVMLCSVIHVVYLFLVDDVFSFSNLPADVYIWMWGAYLTLTEFAPAFTIFVLFRKLPKKKLQYTEIKSSPILNVNSQSQPNSPLLKPLQNM